MRNILLLFLLFSCISLNFGQNQNQIQQNVGNTNVNQNLGNQINGNTNFNQIQINQNNANTNFNPTQRNQNNGDTNTNPTQGNQNNESTNTNPTQGNQNNRNTNTNPTQGNQNNGTMTSGTTNMRNLNVGNPDEGNITRPCQPYDTSCIRRFFAEHAHCKKSYGPVPEPLFRKRDIVYAPRINGTAAFYDVKVTGLNGRIEEFYINRDTDKLVIAIEFRGLTASSDKAYYRIHRRAKEPIIVKSSFNVTYESLVVTAVIPQIYNLRLDKAVIYAFLNDPILNYTFGPELANNPDPQVRAAVMTYAANPRAAAAELLLTDALFYPTTFIQYNICDFGLKIL